MSNPISLSKACRDVIPRFNGTPISPQTCYRWIRAGVLAADGSRVRLSAYRVGRRYLTSEAAVETFFAELQRRSESQTTQVASDDETYASLLAQGLVSA